MVLRAFGLLRYHARASVYLQLYRRFRPSAAAPHLHSDPPSGRRCPRTIPPKIHHLISANITLPFALVTAEVGIYKQPRVADIILRLVSEGMARVPLAECPWFALNRPAARAIRLNPRASDSPPSFFFRSSDLFPRRGHARDRRPR